MTPPLRTPSSTSSTFSDILPSFPQPELPDLNRSISTPQYTEPVPSKSSSSRYSSDIMNTSQFVMVTEDSVAELVVIEAVVEGRRKDNLPRRKRENIDILPELPPLPLEEQLFSPPVERNRAEKSLKVLGEALLAMMPEKGKVKLKMDETAIKLHTSIYRANTVCNVLEAMRLMVRLGRNVYEWQGWKMMMPSLVLIRQMAEKQDMMGQLIKYNDENITKTNTKLNLAMTAQNLLMIFLILPQPRVLSLSVASSIIHGPGLTATKKVGSLQRLAEVSSILQAAGLLAKVKVKVGNDKKATAYQYVGQEVELLPLMDREESSPDCSRTGELMEEGTSKRRSEGLEKYSSMNEGEESSSWRREENTLPGSIEEDGMSEVCVGDEDEHRSGVTVEKMMEQLPKNLSTVRGRKVVRLVFVGEEVDVMVDIN